MASSSAPPPKAPPTLIVGGGLAGLVAAYELTKAKQHVIIVDQENEKNLGGQAFWSLGGIFLVDSPEQRFMGIKDSKELGRQDWFNSAQFDRPEDQDVWAIKWANAYLDFAHEGMSRYLRDLGMGFVKVVGWAERGGRDVGRARQLGSAVPHRMGGGAGGRSDIQGAGSQGGQGGPG